MQLQTFFLEENPASIHHLEKSRSVGSHYGNYMSHDILEGMAVSHLSEPIIMYRYGLRLLRDLCSTIY